MSLQTQLPVLPVIIPLLSAPVALLLPGRRGPWLLAVLSSWLTFAASVFVLVAVKDSGSFISYHLGDWVPALGIEYRIDMLNALLLVLVSAIASVVFPFSYRSLAPEISGKQYPAFFCLLLICLTGLLGVTITGDAFNLFVFLEISSLSTYGLVAMGAGRDRRALTAAFSYLVMGTIGATFYVIGVGLLYQSGGTLNMYELADQIAGHQNRMIQAGFSFILVGTGLKLAMFPVHLWLPNAYTYAPSAVSAFLAATSTKVAVYVLIRFLFSVFSPDFPFVGAAFEYVLFPLAVAGIFAASVVAVFQEDVKRMLAYSSVAQVGYMLLGISFATTAGLTATLVHILNHALIKGAFFMAVACVVYRTGSHALGAFSGLAARMPVTAAAIVLAGLSLVGIPLTTGFVSKWYLLQAAFAGGYRYAGFLVVAGSFIAVIYVGRIVELMLRPGDSGQVTAGSPEPHNVPLSMLVPMWLLVLANVYFGMRPDWTAGLAGYAVRSLSWYAGGAS